MSESKNINQKRTIITSKLRGKCVQISGKLSAIDLFLEFTNQLRNYSVSIDIIRTLKNLPTNLTVTNEIVVVIEDRLLHIVG